MPPLDQDEEEFPQDTESEETDDFSLENAANSPIPDEEGEEAY